MNEAVNPTPATKDLADILRDDDYLRQRLEPKLSDLDYLINSDIRSAITHLCRNLRGRLLDYGCGGSPYRCILPQFSPYIRADISPGPGIDLAFDAKGNLPGEPDGSYDVVLSTQVLEHVADPERYLAEAYRLLPPGGALVLTTHGFFPEHGCPYDFYRWTGYGLERQAENAGFKVEESYKLTSGLRGALYLLSMFIVYDCRWPQGKLIQFFFRAIRSLHFRFGIRTTNWLGRFATHCERIPGHSPEEHLYVGLALLAIKPGGS